MKILKVGAVWCSGCIVMKPIFGEIENELPWLKTEYYDFDKDKKIVIKYNIDQNLPVFIFLDKSEKEIKRLTGEHSKKEILDLIEEFRDL